MSPGDERRPRPLRSYRARMKGTLYITGDPDGDGLLNSDPLALLIGMLLDQNMQ